jgi:fatty acid desaturase (delta-4 desaturase)
LFPRINHTHYHKIAPVVREFCKEKQIPYTHFNTVGENVDALVQHLIDMGKNEEGDQIFGDGKSSARMSLIS